MVAVRRDRELVVARASRGALTWEEFARIRKPDRFSLKDAAAREWPAFIDTMVAKAPKLPL